MIKIINKPYWGFIGVIFCTFTFFGLSSDNFMEIFSDYTWTINATKWSLIFGAFIFAIYAYVIAENNRKHLINIKTSAYDEAYKHFTNQLSYAIGRYKGYVSKLDPGNEKYTKVGVLERINEVKSARLQLLSVCGKHVKSLLSNAGSEWLDDINFFGKTAPSIMEKLAEAEFKDRA